LNGCSAIVSYVPLADGYLVAADTEDNGSLLVYCRADHAGVTLTPQRAGSGEAAGYLRFDAVVIEPGQIVASGSDAEELLEWQALRSYAAIAAQQVCLLREGLQRAAEYTNERKQFGRSLSSFQAVAQQAGDAYMAIEVLRGVYWRALDDLDSGRDAAMSARVAKYWACESGHIAAHIILHVHGGMGQDLDYPIHRFFIWAKQNERYLGGASRHAESLGKLVAENLDQVLTLSA
jgi:alkylation response protein AidB-like acyl-CoA dehydrogenase